MSEAPRGRALVVEDEAAWQEILGEILEDMGLQVDRAADYQAALACLWSGPYRAAVVDLSLNAGSHDNRDGLRVLDAVRRYSPGCVAVLLTGFATVELAVGALTEYGAYSVLRKETFRRTQFRELLARALALAPQPPHPAGVPEAGPQGPGGQAGRAGAEGQAGDDEGRHARAAGQRQHFLAVAVRIWRQRAGQGEVDHG